MNDDDIPYTRDAVDLEHEISNLLWELREGPGVVGVKRDKTVKILEWALTDLKYLKALQGPKCHDKDCLDYDGNHPYHDNAVEKFKALKKANDQIEELKKSVALYKADADKEWGASATERSRLEEELKKTKERLDGALSSPVVAAIEKWGDDQLYLELEWLRFYKKEVYQCLGSGDSEIVNDIKRAYLRDGKQLPLTDSLGD